MKFRIDIYDCTINLVVLKERKLIDPFVKKFNKKYKKDYALGDFDGCVLPIDNRDYTMVLIEEAIGTNLVAHECYHITEFISDANGLSTTGNKEDRAYLNGYINEKIRNLLNTYLCKKPQIVVEMEMDAK